MSNVELALGVRVLARFVDKAATLEANLLSAMRAAPREIWFTTNEDVLFRCAVGAVMDHYGTGSPEWERLEHEVQALRYLSAGLVVGNLDRVVEHMDEAPEPIGLMKLWRESKEPARAHPQPQEAE